MPQSDILSLLGLSIAITMHLYLALLWSAYLPRTLLAQANNHASPVTDAIPPSIPRIRSRAAAIVQNETTALEKDFDDSEKLQSALDLWMLDKDLAAQNHGPIADWNVTQITDFSQLFENAVHFDEDIGSWDVSNARNMSAMFRGALRFNQDLAGWNTSRVVDFSHMFEETNDFNGDISTWDVTTAAELSFMFYNAVSFNSNISGWTIDTSSNSGGLQIRYAQTMESMFEGAVSFQGDLKNWRTDAVTNMRAMFKDAVHFNGFLNAWNVGLVRDFTDMFRDASSFTGELCWNIHESAKTTGMLEGSGGRLGDDCGPVIGGGLLAPWGTSSESAQSHLSALTTLVWTSSFTLLAFYWYW